VMNEQRTIVYEQRQEILRGELLRETVLDMLTDFVGDAVDTYAAEGDLSGLAAWCRRHLGLQVPLDNVDGQSEDELREDLYRRAVERYEEREQRIGADELRRLEQFVLLQTLDMKWKDHLYGMDQVRGQINLRSFAQRDPKLEFKREAYELFDEMIWAVKEEVTGLLFRLELAPAETDGGRNIWQVTQTVHRQYQGFDAQRERAMAASRQGEEKAKPYVFAGTRVGRNDPCPCGSGKKFKKCCGRS